MSLFGWDWDNVDLEKNIKEFFKSDQRKLFFIIVILIIVLFFIFM